MHADEQKIRDLIATWLRASAAGDLPQLLKLMAEDVVFLIPGRPPMRGRDAFAANFQTALQHFQISATSQIQEIQISGEMAYCWNHLSVTMTPRQEGSPVQRSGFVLSIMRKNPDGNWILFRDANLLAAEPVSPLS
ncbi:YybH family protein [Pedosphaera parvula]|nr:SgcJ/EcaC family oxidoreductase [Pedosphaera parvula]